MDHLSTIPPELLNLIITCLPATSTTALRLTSSHFSNSPVLFTHTFSPLLKKWLSEKESHKLISHIASDLVNRPAVMWSPWALEEKMDEDVEMAMLLGDSGVDISGGNGAGKGDGRDVFLEIAFRLVVGCSFSDHLDLLSLSGSESECKSDSDLELESKRGSVEQREKQETMEALTFKNFAAMCGEEEYTEKRLRMGRSRFLLYRKLMREGENGW